MPSMVLLVLAVALLLPPIVVCLAIVAFSLAPPVARAAFGRATTASDRPPLALVTLVPFRAPPVRISRLVR